MRESRRAFLATTFTAAAAASLWTALPAAGQTQQQQPQRDPPPIPGIHSVNPFPEPPVRRDPNLALKADQVHIKKDVDKLSDLVRDLQKGLSDNDTTEVLSLDVIHKTEAIEKLAKQIRDLVRGY